MSILVITVIGTDRAGLVSALAGVVADHEGNWTRSQLAELAGAFAEAYTLVSQLRTGGAEAQHETVAPRPTQSRIQVLRPDGSAADCNFGGK